MTSAFSFGKIQASPFLKYLKPAGSQLVAHALWFVFVASKEIEAELEMFVWSTKWSPRTLLVDMRRGCIIGLC